MLYTKGDKARVRFSDGKERMVPVAKLDFGRSVAASPEREAPAPVKRVVNRGPARMEAQPKPEAPMRDEEHLTFVRGRSCCACGAAPPSDPHHYGPRGMGQKTHDLLVVPFCRACHDSFHAHRRIPGVMGCDTVEGTHLLMVETQVKLMLATALRRGTMASAKAVNRKARKGEQAGE